MSASSQEQFVSLIARCSLGSPYLFEPETYQKGKGTREPCDLAWWCRDTLFLINMYSGRRSHPHQVEYNLRQFRGWLRAWSLGHRLRGRNDWQTFDLAYSDAITVVLLSIVHGPNARAEIHRDWVGDVPRNDAEARVCLAASLPDSVFSRLAQLGGSCLDLANLLYSIAARPLSASESEAHRILEQRRQNDLAVALRVPGTRPDRDRELDEEVAVTFAGALRELPVDAVSDPQAITPAGGVAVFNDLDWAQTGHLVLRAADLIRLVRDVPIGEIGPLHCWARLLLGDYLFLIGVSDVRNLKEHADGLSQLYRQVAVENPGMSPLLIDYHLVGRPKTQFRAALLALPQVSSPSSVGRIVRAAGQRIESGPIASRSLRAQVVMRSRQ